MSAHECETMSHSKSTNRLQMLNPFWATKPGAGQASPAALPAGVSVSHHWALAPSSPHWPLFSCIPYLFQKSDCDVPSRDFLSTYLLVELLVSVG